MKSDHLKFGAGRSETATGPQRFLRKLVSRAGAAAFIIVMGLFDQVVGADPDSGSEWNDKSPHKSAFITVNGVKLHYLDWGGKGETLLFLHGMGDTAHIFDDLAPKLTNQFRVLGLTCRGHGQSEKPESGYDTGTLVEDVRQFLDALKIKRVILVGHSWAGDQLTRFAGAHPGRVMKLVYLDAACDRAGLPEIQKQLPPELFPTKTDMESLDSFRRWVSRMSFWSDAWKANLREIMVFSADGKILREAKPGKVSRLLMQGTVDSHPDYTKIRSPALNIAVVGISSRLSDFVQTLPDSTRAKAEGALSKVKEFQQQQIERFRKEIPGARVVVFTNTDHHCFIEREDEVLREMRAFLGASEWTDKSPHKAGFITVNGVKLHYLDWGGQGDTLLFLHGIGDTPHIYDDLAPKFTNQFRVLGLTRRGHGESEIPDDGYDTATRVEDIRQFLDALNIPRAILVGHSAAGNELSLFAITHPDRAIKLVYLDAAFYMDGQLELFERMLRELPEFSPSAADSESLDSIRRWYKRMNQGWSDAWEATLRVNSIISNLEKRNKALTLMFQTEAHPDHTKIKAPALMITVINPGAYAAQQLKNLSDKRRKAVDDFLTEAHQMKKKEIELFRKAIPNGRLVILPNADHHCFIDREADVLREMRAFLAPTQSHPLQASLRVPVDLQVPMPPTPVKADGKWYLLYELNVTNLGPNNLELMRVEVLRDRAKRPMATYTDEELSRRLKPGMLVTVIAEEGRSESSVILEGGNLLVAETAGAEDFRIESSSDEQEPQVIGRGNRAVMYMLMTVQREADIPAALHHRLFFKSHSAAGNSQEVVVEGARVTVNRKAPLVLSAPLRGAGWVAAEGPSNNDNHHRQAIIVIGGKARIAARFAIDWTRIDADGRFVQGDSANNANWHPYGAEVLAVANAVVADVKDGIPENEGGTGKWAVPLTLEVGAGNYVMLDLGKSNFAVYAHLQPKSIRVRVGQKVRRGQVLGLLGNSGHSYSPHLHFHVANGNSLWAAEGVPYVFDSFEVQGVVPITNGTAPDEAWKPPPNAKTDKRRMEIPIENAVIRFP